MVLVTMVWSGCSLDPGRPSTGKSQGVPSEVTPPQGKPGDASTTLPKQEQGKEPLAEAGLVRVEDIDPTIMVDLRYATENNFTGQSLYPAAVCLLQRSTAEKLRRANQRFQEDGYTIKIWDAYRPLDVQRILWDSTPDKRFVADPRKGSKHNRGCAVDVTLVDRGGNELEMPTGFDDFSPQAARDYPGHTPRARQNMEYLTRIMEESGFTSIRTEWWHFGDSNWRDFPILNIKLEEFTD